MISVVVTQTGPSCGLCIPTNTPPSTSLPTSNPWGTKRCTADVAAPGDVHKKYCSSATLASWSKAEANARAVRHPEAEDGSTAIATKSIWAQRAAETRNIVRASLWPSFHSDVVLPLAMRKAAADAAFTVIPLLRRLVSYWAWALHRRIKGGRADNANDAMRVCTLTPSVIEAMAALVASGLVGIADVTAGGVPPGVAMIADTD